MVGEKEFKTSKGGGKKKRKKKRRIKKMEESCVSVKKNILEYVGEITM